jgi:hypothetical protein
MPLSEIFLPENWTPNLDEYMSNVDKLNFPLKSPMPSSATEPKKQNTISTTQNQRPSKSIVNSSFLTATKNHPLPKLETSSQLLLNLIKLLQADKLGLVEDLLYVVDETSIRYNNEIEIAKNAARASEKKRIEDQKLDAQKRKQFYMISDEYRKNARENNWEITSELNDIEVKEKTKLIEIAAGNAKIPAENKLRQLTETTNSKKQTLLHILVKQQNIANNLNMTIDHFVTVILTLNKTSWMSALLAPDYQNITPLDLILSANMDKVIEKIVSKLAKELVQENTDKKYDKWDTIKDTLLKILQHKILSRKSKFDETEITAEYTKSNEIVSLLQMKKSNSGIFYNIAILSNRHESKANKLLTEAKRIAKIEEEIPHEGLQTSKYISLRSSSKA